MKNEFEVGDEVIFHDDGLSVDEIEDVMNAHITRKSMSPGWCGEMENDLGQKGVILNFREDSGSYGVDFGGDVWAIYPRFLKHATEKLEPKFEIIYEDKSDDEIIELLHDDLPQDPDLDIYEHPQSGISFFPKYIHYEGPNFCGMSWKILERPNKNQEMLDADEVEEPTETIEAPEIPEPTLDPTIIDPIWAAMAAHNKPMPNTLGNHHYFKQYKHD